MRKHASPPPAAVAALLLGLSIAACTDTDGPMGLGDTPLTDGLSASAAQVADNPRQMDGSVWVANLKPLNARVGERAVTGKATLTMDEAGTLTVSMEVKGVVPGRVHPQHIHGHEGIATCPGPRADADGDGVVSVGEGVPDYGPVVVPLAAFPTPDGDRYSYEQSFADQGGLEPARRAIVVHGAFVGDTYVASLPVACGTIERVR